MHEEKRKLTRLNLRAVSLRSPLLNNNCNPFHRKIGVSSAGVCPFVSPTQGLRFSFSILWRRNIEWLSVWGPCYVLHYTWSENPQGFKMWQCTNHWPLITASLHQCRINTEPPHHLPPPPAVSASLLSFTLATEKGEIKEDERETLHSVLILIHFILTVVWRRHLGKKQDTYVCLFFSFFLSAQTFPATIMASFLPFVEKEVCFK